VGQVRQLQLLLPLDFAPRLLLLKPYPVLGIHPVPTSPLPAGDCFTAAFAVALLLEGRSHQEAMRFASSAAALCIQVEGAMPSMPSRQQVDAALAAASAS
jgi:sugar/nucleoside kinase (ribokinase family)